MTLSKIVSIVEPTEMRKGESRNSPYSLFAMNDTSNPIIADPTILLQGNAMSDTHDHDEHNYGYFTIPRALMNHGSFQSAPIKYKIVLLKILEKAVYKPTTHHIGPIEITLKIGQYCVTHRHLADLCNKGVKVKDELIGKTTIPRALLYFEKCHFLGQEVVHGKTLITLSLSRFYNSTEIEVGATFGPQAGQGRGSKQERQERKEETTSKEESVDAAAFLFMKSLGIEESVATDLAKKFSIEQAQVADQFVKHKVSIGKCDVEQGMFVTALKKGWEPPKAKAAVVCKKFIQHLKRELGVRELKYSINNGMLRFLDQDIDLNQSTSEIINKVNIILEKDSIVGIRYEEK